MPALLLFTTMLVCTDLAAKKCVPCNSEDMRSMNEELANQLIAKVSNLDMFSCYPLFCLIRFHIGENCLYSTQRQQSHILIFQKCTWDMNLSYKDKQVNLFADFLLHFCLYQGHHPNARCASCTFFFFQVPDWNLINEEGKLKLARSWKVKTFTKGLEFFQAIANVAEAEGITIFVGILCSWVINFCNMMWRQIDSWREPG